MKEEWREVSDYPDFYISNLGRVYSGFSKKYRSGTIDTRGYYRVCIKRKDGKYKHKSIHRLVAEAFIENPENKRVVNHINGVKTDNTLGNLEWATDSENIQHAYDTGLMSRRGLKNTNAKLREVEVLKIRSLKGVFTYTELSLLFKVSARTIGQIQRRERWKHL